MLHTFYDFFTTTDFFLSTSLYKLHTFYDLILKGFKSKGFKPVMEIRLFQESGSLSISPEDLILHFFLVNIFCPYWEYLKEMFFSWERQVNI